MARRVSLSPPSTNPFGAAGQSFSAFDLVNPSQEAYLAYHKVEVAWQAGTVDDDTYLAALKTYANALDPDTSEYVSAQAQLVQDTYTIARNKLVDEVNAGTKTVEDLLAFDQQSIVGLNSGSQEYRQRLGYIANESDQKAYDTYKKVEDAWNAGTATDQQYLAALSTYANSLPVGTTNYVNAQQQLQAAQYSVSRDELVTKVNNGSAQLSDLLAFDQSHLQGLTPNSQEYRQRLDALQNTQKAVFSKQEAVKQQQWSDGKLTTAQLTKWYQDALGSGLVAGNQDLVDSITTTLHDLGSRALSEQDSKMIDEFNNGKIGVNAFLTYAKAAQSRYDQGTTEWSDWQDRIQKAGDQAKETNLTYRYQLSQEFANNARLIASDSLAAARVGHTTSKRIVLGSDGQWHVQTVTSTHKLTLTPAEQAAWKKRQAQVTAAKARNEQIARTIGQVPGGWVSTEDMLTYYRTVQGQYTKGSDNWYQVQSKIDGLLQQQQQEKVYKTTGLIVTYPWTSPDQQHVGPTGQNSVNHPLKNAGNIGQADDNTFNGGNLQNAQHALAGLGMKVGDQHIGVTENELRRGLAQGHGAVLSILYSELPSQYQSDTGFAAKGNKSGHAVYVSGTREVNGHTQVFMQDPDRPKGSSQGEWINLEAIMAATKAFAHVTGNSLLQVMMTPNRVTGRPRFVSEQTDSGHWTGCTWAATAMLYMAATGKNATMQEVRKFAGVKYNANERTGSGASNGLNTSNRTVAGVADKPEQSAVAHANQTSIHNTSPANDGQSISLDQFMRAIGNTESGGNYTDRNKASGAFGKYQIMPANWPAWAKQYLGDAQAPQTPENQEKVARAKITDLYSWLGDWRLVAKWWLTGGNPKKDGPPSQWSAGARAYVRNVMTQLGGTLNTTATTDGKAAQQGNPQHANLPVQGPGTDAPWGAGGGGGHTNKPIYKPVQLPGTSSPGSPTGQKPGTGTPGVTAPKSSGGVTSPLEVYHSGEEVIRRSGGVVRTMHGVNWPKGLDSQQFENFYQGFIAAFKAGSDTFTYNVSGKPVNYVIPVELDQRGQMLSALDQMRIDYLRTKATMYAGTSRTSEIATQKELSSAIADAGTNQLYLLDTTNLTAATREGEGKYNVNPLADASRLTDETNKFVADQLKLAQDAFDRGDVTGAYAFLQLATNRVKSAQSQVATYINQTQNKIAAIEKKDPGAAVPSVLQTDLQTVTNFVQKPDLTALNTLATKIYDPANPGRALISVNGDGSPKVDQSGNIMLAPGYRRELDGSGKVTITPAPPNQWVPGPNGQMVQGTNDKTVQVHLLIGGQWQDVYAKYTIGQVGVFSDGVTPVMGKIVSGVGPDGQPYMSVENPFQPGHWSNGTPLKISLPQGATPGAAPNSIIFTSAGQQYELTPNAANDGTYSLYGFVPDPNHAGQMTTSPTPIGFTGLSGPNGDNPVSNLLNSTGGFGQDFTGLTSLQRFMADTPGGVVGDPNQYQHFINAINPVSTPTVDTSQLWKSTRDPLGLTLNQPIPQGSIRTPSGAVVPLQSLYNARQNQNTELQAQAKHQGKLPEITTTPTSNANLRLGGTSRTRATQEAHTGKPGSDIQVKQPSRTINPLPKIPAVSRTRVSQEQHTGRIRDVVKPPVQPRDKALNSQGQWVTPGAGR